MTNYELIAQAMEMGLHVVQVFARKKDKTAVWLFNSAFVHESDAIEHAKLFGDISASKVFDSGGTVLYDSTVLDLSTCKKGDKLRIVLNEDQILKKNITDIVTYIEPLECTAFYDHLIEYSDGTQGTRCNNGNCYRNKRLNTDLDVVEIIGG